MQWLSKIKGIISPANKTGETSKTMFSSKYEELVTRRTQELADTCICTICDKSQDRGACVINTPENRYLKEVLHKVDIDPNKETILLMDDNSGVISFLVDDLRSLQKKGLFDYTEYNLLTIDTKLASFKLRALIKSKQKLNIKYAIYDITLGGTLFNDEGMNITLDGVDSFIDVQQVYPNTKYLFYTGNKLNPYIKKNEETITKFKNFTGENIEKHILFKTSLSRAERQEYLLNFLTSK